MYYKAVIIEVLFTKAGIWQAKNSDLPYTFFVSKNENPSVCTRASSCYGNVFIGFGEKERPFAYLWTFNPLNYAHLN